MIATTRSHTKVRAAVGVRTCVATALSVVWLVAAGCAATAPSTDPAQGSAGSALQGSITVAAASSLFDPFTVIGEAFERSHPGTKVRFTFDSSSTLAHQIVGGATVDVFAAADTTSMTAVDDAGMLSAPPTTFATNELAIVVKRDNPRRVQSLADLAKVDVVSLCGADVPCGRYADDVLARAHVLLPAEHITRGPNAKATFTAVADGDADAGIVYRTDITGDRVTAVPIPGDQNTRVRYPIAVVTSSANRRAAEAFVALVRSPDGQAALAAAGFGPP